MTDLDALRARHVGKITSVPDPEARAVCRADLQDWPCDAAQLLALLDAAAARPAGLREALIMELQDAVPETCDWGGCDNNAMMARFDGTQWLPVCQWHSDDAGASELAPITVIGFAEAWLAAGPTLDEERLARALAEDDDFSLGDVSAYRAEAARLARSESGEKA